jgi:hypothetical protein
MLRLKAALLNKGNEYPSVPTAYDVHMKLYHNMHYSVKHIQYGDYSWQAWKLESD